MKRIIPHVTAWLLWLIGTLAVSHIWLTRPSLMPVLPRPFWNWLLTWYRPTNAEEVADMEMIVVIPISGVVVAVVIAAVWAAAGLGLHAWRRGATYC